MLWDKFSPPALLPSATAWFRAVAIGTTIGCPLVKDRGREIDEISKKHLSTIFCFFYWLTILNNICGFFKCHHLLCIAMFISALQNLSFVFWDLVTFSLHLSRKYTQVICFVIIELVWFIVLCCIQTQKFSHFVQNNFYTINPIKIVIQNLWFLSAAFTICTVFHDD